MARRYPFVEELARRLEAARAKRALSFERLGHMTGINTAQVWRICQGKFTTLNPSVLRICKELGVAPHEEELPSGDLDDSTKAQLTAEVVAAWDRSEAGAQLLTRVLRALRPV